MKHSNSRPLSPITYANAMNPMDAPAMMGPARPSPMPL
jgi:hypothetical protein